MKTLNCIIILKYLMLFTFMYASSFGNVKKQEKLLFCEGHNLCELSQKMIDEPRTTKQFEFLNDSIMTNKTIGEVLDIIQLKNKFFDNKLGFQMKFDSVSIIGGLYYFRYSKIYDGLIIFCTDTTEYIKTDKTIFTTSKKKLKTITNRFKSIRHFKTYQFLIDKRIKPLPVPDAKK